MCARVDRSRASSSTRLLAVCHRRRRRFFLVARHRARVRVCGVARRRRATRVGVRPTGFCVVWVNSLQGQITSSTLASNSSFSVSVSIFRFFGFSVFRFFGFSVFRFFGFSVFRFFGFSRVASRRSRAGATRRRADARSDGGATVAVIEDGSRRRAGSDDRVGEPRVGERNETKRIIHCVDL